MLYTFASIEDTPDVEIQRGQLVSWSYEYNWGSDTKGTFGEFVCPVQIHAKDLLKGRQARLRYLHPLHGKPPTLSNINLEIFNSS